jgi:hypothetical protein
VCSRSPCISPSSVGFSIVVSVAAEAAGQLPRVLSSWRIRTTDISFSRAAGTAAIAMATPLTRSTELRSL